MSKREVTAIAKNASFTNHAEQSLVKVVSAGNASSWVTPAALQEFYIDEDATFPEIIFEISTAHPPPYTGSWTLTWEAKTRTRENTARSKSTQKTFTETGRFSSQHKKWQADLSRKVLGGTWAVEIKAGKDTFKRSVIIKGKNPSQEDVTQFLSTLENVSGFELVIEKESAFKNFITADGEPLLSFDGGYGLTQITNPAPTYEQVWSWKENIKVGSNLYQEKQKIAKNYLSKDDRDYTEEQLKLETLSRWNGGAYHVWSAASQQWQRKDSILCDSKTGNIGWDKSAPENKDQTEAQLHDRDKDSYANPKNKTASNKWNYTGVCYADHLLGE